MDRWLITLFLIEYQKLLLNMLAAVQTIEHENEDASEGTVVTTLPEGTIIVTLSIPDGQLIEWVEMWLGAFSVEEMEQILRPLSRILRSLKDPEDRIDALRRIVAEL